MEQRPVLSVSSPTQSLANPPLGVGLREWKSNIEAVLGIGTEQGGEETRAIRPAPKSAGGRSVRNRQWRIVVMPDEKKKIGRPLGSTTTEGWIKKSHIFRPSVLARIEQVLKAEELSRAAFVNRAIERELKRVEKLHARRQREGI
tara:strand:+ start:710 stop:1144 length:435 start_codon:yes stop_codon:yes gene_type:complete